MKLPFVPKTRSAVVSVARRRRVLAELEVVAARTAEEGGSAVPQVVAKLRPCLRRMIRRSMPMPRMMGRWPVSSGRVVAV